MVRRRVSAVSNHEALVPVPGLVLRDASLRDAPQDEGIKLVMTQYRSLQLLKHEVLPRLNHLDTALGKAA